MFDWFNSDNDEEFGVDSYTGEATMFDPMGMPGRGQGGMQALEQAMLPPAPGMGGGKPVMGSNIIGAQQTAMMPGQNNPSLPQPGGQPMPGKPITVDEAQMENADYDPQRAYGMGRGGSGRGNKAARIGEGVGGLLKLYGGSKGWF